MSIEKNMGQNQEKATFKELRDIREILEQINDKRREEFVDLLEKVDGANFTLKDLIGILKEDCGEYVGSWVEPKDSEKE